MPISLRTERFNPYDELQYYQAHKMNQAGQYGATVCFLGTMRDFNAGETIRKMDLEYYPAMTERHLEQIIGDARNRWNLIDALVIHRVGEVFPNDPIVLVATWSSHRAVAFDACRYILEELKSRAPFWKKETLPQGERWVEHNTRGY